MHNFNTTCLPFYQLSQGSLNTSGIQHILVSDHENRVNRLFSTTFTAYATTYTVYIPSYITACMATFTVTTFTVFII
ncbi:hypothetical protein DPMN_009642 [Dreissena polymorpha]|uniref:Uncharacterized protein n=1 Tax=Dreissena polymorpha TaxID=45954 RepID=A0A9D4S0S2_DREPO|nr:hypothetical protein DPMN_009642 [Dreissena polymorpha]